MLLRRILAPATALVQLGVVEPGRDDVFHGAARRRPGNEAAHQQAGDAGVAVGKVKDVGFVVFRQLLGELLADPGAAGVEKGVAGAAEQAVFEQFPSGHDIRAEAHQHAGCIRKGLDPVFRQSENVAQEILGAHFLERRRAGPHRGFRQEGGFAPHQLGQRLFGLGGQRIAADRSFLVRRRGFADLEGMQGIEKNLRRPAVRWGENRGRKIHAGFEAEALEEAAVEVVVEIVCLQGQRSQETLRRPGILAGLVDALAAAVADQGAAIHAEFIALGVAAEVVVVVQNQHLGAAAGPVSEKPSRRQPGEAAADHRQIVFLVGPALGPGPAGAFHGQAVGRLVGAGMAAAQTSQGWRIMGARQLCRGVALPRHSSKRAQAQSAGRQGQREAVEKIAPGDAAVHLPCLLPRNGPHCPANACCAPLLPMRIAAQADGSRRLFMGRIEARLAAFQRKGASGGEQGRRTRPANWPHGRRCKSNGPQAGSGSCAWRLNPS